MAPVCRSVRVGSVGGQSVWRLSVGQSVWGLSVGG